MVDKLILREICGYGWRIISYPQIRWADNNMRDYLVFDKITNCTHEAVGIVRVPEGWWAELVKDCDDLP